VGQLNAARLTFSAASALNGSTVVRNAGVVSAASHSSAVNMSATVVVPLLASFKPAWWARAHDGDAWK